MRANRIGTQDEQSHVQPILRMTKMTKSFSGVKALNQVSLDVQPGEVLALVGENGAGKSTMMKILIGLETSDSGSIQFKGSDIAFRSPSQALAQGISMIHQEISLVPGLSVAENVWLGREQQFATASFVGTKRRVLATKELFERLGFNIPAEVLVSTLSIAEMQLVEIARAVSYDSSLIIMDEPTSALTPSEIELLYTTIGDLTSSGVSVIFISHKLDEVFRLAQRVNVMRDGESLGAFQTSELTVQSLMAMIAGRELSEVATSKHDRSLGSTMLEVRNFRIEGVPSGVSFSVAKGEVLGFCGLMGAGRTEIMRSLYGLDRGAQGEVIVDGRSVTIRSPRDAVKAGLGMITEDRLRSGSIYSLSVLRNSTLAAVRQFRGRLLTIRSGMERDSYRSVAAKLNIKAPSPDSLIGHLSGGNQQKVLISRWFYKTPKVLILDEPTRGIDVGAKAEIYELIDALAEQGLAVVVVSSELPELLAISDRIVVVREGQIVHEENTRDATQAGLLAHAFGVSKSSTN